MSADWPRPRLNGRDGRGRDTSSSAARSLLPAGWHRLCLPGFRDDQTVSRRAGQCVRLRWREPFSALSSPMPS